MQSTSSSVQAHDEREGGAPLHHPRGQRLGHHVPPARVRHKLNFTSRAKQRRWAGITPLLCIYFFMDFGATRP